MSAATSDGTWITPITRDLVWVTGVDAATFLQGQLSQDIDTLEVGDSRPTLLLAPTGKVVAWGRVTRTGADQFVVDVAAGTGESVVARLSRFLIRTDAEVRAEPAVAGLAVRGRAGAQLPDSPAQVRAAVEWGPEVAGVDLIGLDDSHSVDDAGVLEPDGGRLEALRIRCGIPEMGSELDDTVIPGEAGQAVIEAAVSFTKGCYVGQELVTRVHSRGGNTPRKLRTIELTADGAAPGDEIVAGGAAVGVLTSVGRDADGAVALGFINRAAAEVADVEVAASDGAIAARLRPAR